MAAKGTTKGQSQRGQSQASGVGNMGVVQATGGPHHGLPASATVTVPPLATLWLRPA